MSRVPAGAARALLRLLPRPWRARYGDELLELLAASRRPVRDTLDGARLAAGLHLVRIDHLEEATVRRLLLLALACAVAGGVGAAWAAANLADGLAEIPNHWWSTLAVSPLGLSAALTLAGVRAGWTRAPG